MMASTKKSFPSKVTQPFHSPLLVAQRYVTAGAVLLVIAVLCAWEPWRQRKKIRDVGALEPAQRMPGRFSHQKTWGSFQGLSLAIGASHQHLGCCFSRVHHFFVIASVYHWQHTLFLGVVPCCSLNKYFLTGTSITITHTHIYNTYNIYTHVINVQ